LTGFRPARGIDQRGDVPMGSVIANKYRVEQVLGEGAMGIVLAARHLELDELVAIKCIRAQMPWSPDVIARFAREAKASARLKSEHIAKVTDVGVSPPVGPYMVMEYLEGEDLAAVLKRRGPLSVLRVAEYVMQICEALAHAHAASITHRDVKPGNLFLTRHGDLEVIKVLDFGISKTAQSGRLFGGEISVKETSTLMGTPLYMSPEQIRSTREVDHRSDLWSLGVVMFELLTGRPAFPAETVTQLCALVLEASPPPLAEHCRNAPPALAAIIERCLRKDPAERYQSSAELANDLLPFAPPRARLHAERAAAVLRFADPRAGKPLPSTLTEERGAKDSSLETAAPTVLAASVASRGGLRASTLAVAVAAIVCVGLSFAGYRGLRAPSSGGVKQAASLVEVATSPGVEKPGRSAAPATKAHLPTPRRAEGATPRTAPALPKPKPKTAPARARTRARPDDRIRPH
jgi:serine/threonine-protein kinase